MVWNGSFLGNHIQGRLWVSPVLPVSFKINNIVWKSRAVYLNYYWRIYCIWGGQPAAVHPLASTSNDGGLCNEMARQTRWLYHFLYFAFVRLWERVSVLSSLLRIWNWPVRVRSFGVIPNRWKCIDIDAKIGSDFFPSTGSGTKAAIQLYGSFWKKSIRMTHCSQKKDLVIYVNLTEV